MLSARKYIGNLALDCTRSMMTGRISSSVLSNVSLHVNDEIEELSNVQTK